MSLLELKHLATDELHFLYLSSNYMIDVYVSIFHIIRDGHSSDILDREILECDNARGVRTLSMLAVERRHGDFSSAQRLSVVACAPRTVSFEMR